MTLLCLSQNCCAKQKSILNHSSFIAGKFSEFTQHWQVSRKVNFWILSIGYFAWSWKINGHICCTELLNYNRVPSLVENPLFQLGNNRSVYASLPRAALDLCLASLGAEPDIFTVASSSTYRRLLRIWGRSIALPPQRTLKQDLSPWHTVGVKSNRLHILQTTCVLTQKRD